ncbi:MAG: ComEA family DNA-binding protein [Cyanobacteria bacterium P01_A01_bin.84]
MKNWLPNQRLQRLRSKLLNDPYYRLQSGEEIAIAAQLGMRIDANQATVDDWLRLPGISIRQARALSDLTRSGVKFYCIEDVSAALNMPLQRLLPLQPILSFVYYDDESLDKPVKLINPNTANIEILLQVPFINESLAQAIIENRSSGGHYRNLADLGQRLRLSPDVITQLMYYLQF